MEKLKRKLSKFGTLQICKAGYVLTILMTGNNLDHWTIVKEIEDIILDYAGTKYPVIETLKNEDAFFMIVLKPKQ